MTILEQYQKSEKWSDKVTLMELFHLGKRMNDKTWTLAETAKQFNVSMGLVSENLKLAAGFHNHPELEKCESRQKALDKLGRYNG